MEEKLFFSASEPYAPGKGLECASLPLRNENVVTIRASFVQQFVVRRSIENLPADENCVPQ
jgi:hypothetical protein